MADYNITFPDGSPHTIQTGTIDNTYDVPLVGQDAINYGDDFATAYVRLLSSFANTSAPSFGTTRVTGQLWYDTTPSTGGLNVYDGTGWDKVALEGSVVTLTGAQTISGVKTFSSAPDFTASGSPFTVNSTTLVDNLNAELLNGSASTAFATAAQGVTADNAEPDLGLPPTNGYVLSSTTGGARSWVSPAVGTGNVNPADISGAASPATMSLVLTDDPTGDQQPYTDSGLTFNGTTNTLTTTTFVGNLTGNADTATLATTATTATAATTVTLTNEAADTTTFVAFANTATGDQQIHTNASLAFNSSTGTLSATAFAGSGSNLTALNANNISSGTLSVARGGTGVTTSTGSGSAFVLSTSPTFTTKISTPVVDWATGPIIQYNGTNYISHNSLVVDGETTASQVRTRAGTDVDIGLNLMPISRSSPSSGYTLTDTDTGHMTLKQGTTAFTITLPNNANGEFPIGSTHNVINGGSSGDITVADGGETLYYLDGASAQQDVGANCTIAVGGVATIYRATAAIYYIWGSRITP